VPNRYDHDVRIFSRPLAVAAAFGIVIVGSWLPVAAGCGFDLPGTKEAPGAGPPDGSSPQDAAVDHVDASADPVDAAVEAAAKSRCDDPAMILCVDFDGTVVDGAHGLKIDVAGNVGFTPGIVGQAAVLDATSRVTTADGPAWAFTSLTLETWVRPDALPPAGGRYALLDKDGSFGLFVYGNGTIGCSVSQAVSAPALLTPGVWVHVACVNDGSSTTLYVAGAVKAKAVSSGGPSTTALVAIGNNSPNFGAPLIGAIDELRVYSRAKTAAEVSADAKR
jgi:hypothetical protein